MNGLAVLLAGDVSLFPHEPEHDVPSSDGGGTPHEGVEMIGRGDQSREHRALRERQIARIDADVGPGRGLDPVGPLTEVHRVQVPREDLKLREPVLELPCQERLVDLPAEALIVAGVQVLHQLLGDRRAALDDVSAPKIVDRGPQDRLGVDAMMGVEASVLDRDDGVSDVLRHLRARERDPVLGRMQRGDERSVRRVQERRLRERPDVVVLQSRQAARGHPAGEAGERDTGGEGSPDLPHTSEAYPRT